MPDVLSASQLADERAARRAEVAALVKERDEALELAKDAEAREHNIRRREDRTATEGAKRAKAQRERAETAEAQRDAWAARYTDLANAVLEGVYLNYDVKEDSGGSSFLCTCEHDGDGFPHEEWCGALLTSALETA